MDVFTEGAVKVFLLLLEKALLLLESFQHKPHMEHKESLLQEAKRQIK